MSSEGYECGIWHADRLTPVCRAEKTYLKRPRERGCDHIQETVTKA